MKSKLTIISFSMLAFFLINKTATAQVKPGKTIVPEKIENTITVKPAVKKMQPALADDPWKNKLESYTPGSDESNVLKSETSEKTQNATTGNENKTNNYPPKDSKKSTRVKISQKKEIQNPAGK